MNSPAPNHAETARKQIPTADKVTWAGLPQGCDSLFPAVIRSHLGYIKATTADKLTWAGLLQGCDSLFPAVIRSHLGYIKATTQGVYSLQVYP